LNAQYLSSQDPPIAHQYPLFWVIATNTHPRAAEWVLDTFGISTLNQTFTNAVDFGVFQEALPRTPISEFIKDMGYLPDVDAAYFAALQNQFSTLVLLQSFGASLTRIVGGTTVAHMVFSKEPLEQVEALLYRPIDWTVMDRNGQNVAFVAYVRNPHIPLLQAISNLGIHANQKASDGTPVLFKYLFDCSVSSDPTKLAFLLNHGADVTERFQEKNPFHLLASCPHSGMLVTALRKSVVGINGLNRERQSPLAIACESGLLEHVEWLSRYGANLNFMDASGRNLILFTLDRYGGRNGTALRAIVASLAEKGVNLAHVDSDRQNALHYALQRERASEAVTSFLLSRRVFNVNARDRFNNTALFLGLKPPVAPIGMIKTLLNSTPTPNTNLRGALGIHNLELVLQYPEENLEILELELLLQKGMDPESRNSVTVLPIFQTTCSINALKLLHQYGASLNLTNPRDGNTILHTLPLTIPTSPAHWKCLESHHYLVQNRTRFGLNIDAKNGNGDTPLHIVAKQTRYDTLVMGDRLIRNKANVFIKNLQGKTAYDVCQNDDLRYVLGVAMGILP
jgi:ankyrin repeat protein